MVPDYDGYWILRSNAVLNSLRSAVPAGFYAGSPEGPAPFYQRTCSNCCIQPLHVRRGHDIISVRRPPSCCIERACLANEIVSDGDGTKI